MRSERSSWCAKAAKASRTGTWPPRSKSLHGAHLAAGNRSEADHYVALAQSELDKVADPEDREIIGSQLAELNL